MITLKAIYTLKYLLSVHNLLPKYLINMYRAIIEIKKLIC